MGERRGSRRREHRLIASRGIGRGHPESQRPIGKRWPFLTVFRAVHARILSLPWPKPHMDSCTRLTGVAEFPGPPGALGVFAAVATEVDIVVCAQSYVPRVRFACCREATISLSQATLTVRTTTCPRSSAEAALRRGRGRNAPKGERFRRTISARTALGAECWSLPGCGRPYLGCLGLPGCSRGNYRRSPCALPGC